MNALPDLISLRNASLSGSGRMPVVLAKMKPSYCLSAVEVIFSAISWSLRTYSTVNAPLFCPSSPRIFSAVGMELWRKPLVTVTTRSFLGVAACVETKKAQNRPNKQAMEFGMNLFFISSTSGQDFLRKLIKDSFAWDAIHLA